MKYLKKLAAVLAAMIFFSAGAFSSLSSTKYLKTPSASSFVYTNSEKFYANVNDYLTLRKKASSSSDEITKIMPNEELTQLGVKGRYSYVETKNGLKGYVMQRYLLPVKEDRYLSKLDIVRTDTSKYSHSIMMEDAAALQERYPDDMQLFTAGESVDGREIIAICIGDLDAPIQILVQAAIHGRENMTSQYAMKEAEYILYALDHIKFQGKIGREYLKGVAFHILPMTNPDGVEISIQNSAGALENGSKKLENIKAANGGGSSYYKKWKANANGVDLNRNFDIDWGLRATASSPAQAQYPGKSAGSEPETKALINYIDYITEETGVNFAATISLHSYGSEIYWQCAADMDLQKRTLSLAQAASKTNGYPLLTDASSYQGGGFKDWAMKKRGIPSITIELGLQSAPLPSSEFPLLWGRNRKLLLNIAKWARG